VAIGHAVRGAATAGLALIALEAIGSDKTGKVGSFFADVNNLIAKALSPDVPLIRDRSKGFYDADGNYHPYIPGYLGGGTTTAPGAGGKSNPKFVPKDVPDPNNPNPQYDNPHPNRPGGVWD